MERVDITKEVLSRLETMHAKMGGSPFIRVVIEEIKQLVVERDLLVEALKDCGCDKICPNHCSRCDVLRKLGYLE